MRVGHEAWLLFVDNLASLVLQRQPSCQRFTCGGHDAEMRRQVL